LKCATKEPVRALYYYVLHRERQEGGDDGTHPETGPADELIDVLGGGR
jgi:hypothetical protein